MRITQAAIVVQRAVPRLANGDGPSRAVSWRLEGAPAPASTSIHCHRLTREEDASEFAFRYAAINRVEGHFPPTHYSKVERVVPNAFAKQRGSIAKYSRLRRFSSSSSEKPIQLNARLQRLALLPNPCAPPADGGGFGKVDPPAYRYSCDSLLAGSLNAQTHHHRHRNVCGRRTNAL